MLFKNKINDLNFKRFKTKAMRKYKQALESNLVDEDAKPINNIINKNKNYYTTSSCAGRITLDGYNGEENKKIHTWIAKWHRTITLEELNNKLKEVENYKTVYLRTDPFIFHIGCRTIEDAQKILSRARDIGLKRSGIIETKKRIMIEIIGLDELHIPLKHNNHIIILNQKIPYLLNLINEKQTKNIERRQKLLKTLLNINHNV